MTSSVIQTSFNAGEFAPALYARVDLNKYHSGAALLRNFFVDYRGGATTRPGTKYILKAKSNTVRLIPFNASFAVTYILEFGPGYIRFYNNGAPVLETATTISGATQASPGVITDTTHGYANGDWIFISGVVGMTQLNGNYYIIAGATTNTYTLQDLYGNAVNTTTFGAYISGGVAQRVYTLNGANVPYQANDLAGIKYAQDVNLLILCHPNYAPRVLTLNSSTNWTIAPISFAPTIAAPSISAAVAGSGTLNVNYVVTAVDANGQESIPSNIAAYVGTVGTATTQTISWTAITGAVAYNVYRTIFTSTTIGTGQPFGYVGTSSALNFLDMNITPNFAITAPIIQNPFAGAGVNALTLTSGGSQYQSVPAVSFSGGSPSTPATAFCYLGANSAGVVNVGSYNIDPTGYTLSLGNGVAFTITAAAVGISTFHIVSGYLSNAGALSSGLIPNNPVAGNNGSLAPYTNTLATFNLTWVVTQLFLSSPGAGYAGAPSVVFTGGSPVSTATATAALGAAGAGNPSVPGFIQQRSFFGGPAQSPSQMNLSQPGAPFNFNITFPPQADNAIQETLTNTVLNSIKSFITVSAGGIVFTDKGAWLINGGAPGAPISALDIVANPQAYSGASDLPPILTNQDIIYVQSKNSIVRDLAFNFYLNNYVGADISVISSHLFYGYTLTSWTWAEEPFKIIWAVRNDGQLLSLTFVKEQELLAWAHHDTLGSFLSVASVNENTVVGNEDSTYFAVQRSINGQTVTYIERLVELYYQNDYKSSWQVDAGIGYNGPPASTFSGAQHLAGAAVTGVADGIVISFTMPASGTFVFGGGGTPGLTGIASASIVTVGLPFMPQLTTLPLDLGEPTVQGKRKSIKGLSAKVANTLGLSAGRSIATVVPLNDTTLGALGTMSNTPVTGLVTGDVRLILDPIWDVYGQYSITQSNPYPASILGVVPEIETEDKQ